MRFASGIGLLVVLSAAGGCMDDEYAVSGPAWVEIGTGVDDFASLAEVSEVPIVTGIQGGHMIPLSVRAGGVVPGDDADPDAAQNPSIEYRAFRVDTGELVGTATRTLGLRPVDRDTVELLGTWLLFDLTVDSAELHGQDLRVEVDLTDVRGVTAADAGTCRVVEAP